MRTDEATIPRITWLGSVGVHAHRLLKRWLRSPSLIGSTIGMPTVMIVTILIMFNGMVERFTNIEMNIASIVVMVGVSVAFTGALMGAGNTVQERHQGLPDRLWTMPGHVSAPLAGRVLAEGTRAFVSELTALAVGLAYGADFGGVRGLAATLLLQAVVALTAGSLGVMLGYVVDTPQGAVSFAPLVMAAMFFNTGMMPRDMYAEILRPIVDISPMTAAIEVSRDAVDGSFDAKHLVTFVLWFGVLLLLNAVILMRKATAQRR